MKFVEFEIRSLDDDLSDVIKESGTGQSYYTINPSVRFSFDRTLEAGTGSDCFLPINSETIDIRKEFTELVEQSNGSPLGAYTLTDSYILGSPGIVVDRHHKICWTGYSIGWNLGNLRKAVARNDIGYIVDDKTLRVREGLLDLVDKTPCSVHSDNVCLLSQPGYGIFGHWLIDIAPRLNYIRNKMKGETAPIFTSATATWGKEIAKIYKIDLSRQPEIRHETGIKTRRLTIPGCIKYNRIIDSYSAISAWNVMRREYATIGQTNSTKIYASRSNLQSNRKFENSVEIDHFFRSMGWLVINSEKLTLREQAAEFSRASIIVGDDGSSLHNSIYSRRGTKILCLDFQRGNILHASVANVLDHKLAYLNCETYNDHNGDPHWIMPIPRIKHALQLMGEPDAN